MDTSRPFVPAFIKKIDRTLLLKNPSVWSARTHLVVYFGVLFGIVLALLCCLFNMDVRQESSTGVLTGFVILISFIGLVFWLIYLLRFNVFKRFGNWQPGDGIRTFLLFFVNILVLVAIPFIPASVESFMANSQYGDAELVNDVNEMNKTVNMLEYAQIPASWRADTFTVYKQTYTIGADRDTIWESKDVATVYSANNFTISERELVTKIEYADSLQKINDSLYVFYQVPGFAFIKPYALSEPKGLKLMSSIEIYNAYLKNYKPQDKARLTKRLEELKAKYAVHDRYGYDSYYAADQTDYGEYVRNKYKLYEAENIIDRIGRKKSFFSEGAGFISRGIFYPALILTLLIFIFRHTTVKTFFLSILAGVLLAVVTGLFVAVGDMRETGLFTIMILYFVAFGIIACTAFNANKRTLVQGIGINFFLFFLPFIPVMLTAFYWETINHNDPYVPYVERGIYYFYAELIGVVLLLILIDPLFRRLYRAWYAAPQE